MKRNIAVVTTSRADYSHLYWVLKAIDAHSALNLQLIAYGPHLSPEYGLTVSEIQSDGFEIRERIECLLSSDTDVGMAKTIGLATLSLADSLDRLRPDILLVIADRYEMMAAASVAVALRIPIAHIEGGEISAGAIDDAIRNALTKLSHLHFVPHTQAAERVSTMGEHSWRITVSGAPSLDQLQHWQPPTRDELLGRLEIASADPLLVIAHHPVTMRADTTEGIEALFQSLEKTGGTQVFCFPNADTGSHRIMARAKQYCQQQELAKLFVNLPLSDYFGLLSHADAIIGNSSSAIMESASFRLPAVNIGERQHGRLCADNIISVDMNHDQINSAIETALSTSFREGLAELVNPYGQGNAGELIAEGLASCPLGESLLFKHSLES